VNIQQLDEKYVLQTYARNEVSFVKGESATLWDENGKKYIDFTSGIAVVSVGHANKQLTQALCKQIGEIIHISNLYHIAPQAKAAQAVVEASGYDMQCFFGNSGAEANEGAIKIARKYGEVDGEIKRYKIITLKHSFHGRTITTVKATGQEKMHNYFGPFPDGFVYAENVDEIQSLVDEHTVAVMIELVQGEGGVEPLEKKRVQELAKFLKTKDVLLIVDEVQTGCYRTGEFLASNLYEIVPDIITLAKGVGGGVPVGIVLSSKKDVLSAGDHGSTFGGNYLSATAVCEVVDILTNYKQKGELDLSIAYFWSKLKELYKNHTDIFTKEVGVGLMCGLRCVDANTLNAVVEKAQECGVMVLKAGKNTLRILPPLTITTREIDEGFNALESALSSL